MSDLQVQVEEQLLVDDGAGGERNLSVNDFKNVSAVRLDEVGDVTFVGEAQAGSAESAAVWRIKRIDESSGTSITWADGDTDFDNVWNNRLSLNYS